MEEIMQKIQKILTEAKQNRWPYPKTFDALKKEGVSSYAVSLSGSYSAVYQTANGVWEEEVPDGYKAVSAALIFDAQKVQKSIRDHIEKSTSFTEVLFELAASGVSHYKVDMAKRTVTYYNNDETGYYTETVPSQ